MVKLVILYRNKLRMSPGKMAAGVAHAVASLKIDPEMTVIVLGVTESKFNAAKRNASVIIKDAGYTEVNEGTEVCLGYFAPLSHGQVRKRWSRMAGRALTAALSNPYTQAPTHG